MHNKSKRVRTIIIATIAIEGVSHAGSTNIIRTNEFQRYLIPYAISANILYPKMAANNIYYEEKLIVLIEILTGRKVL
jgi:hypothetical protein